MLFPSERALCDQIFEGKHAWKDHCFAAATSKSLLNLLSFGQAISKSKTSPDKVFLLLDMFDRTLELQSEVKFQPPVVHLSIAANAVNDTICT